MSGKTLRFSYSASIAVAVEDEVEVDEDELEAFVAEYIEQNKLRLEDDTEEELRDEAIADFVEENFKETHYLPDWAYEYEQNERTAELIEDEGD